MKFLALLSAFLALPMLAQTNQGAFNTPQMNTTLYVKSLSSGQLYPTIQSAVTKACTLGAATVDIPSGSTPADTIAAATGGCTTAGIIDERTIGTTGSATGYTWNGSAYVKSAAGGNIPQMRGSLIAPTAATPLGSQTSVNVPLVTGAVAGDTTFIAVSSTNCVTLPSGWTQLYATAGGCPAIWYTLIFEKALSSGDISTGHIAVTIGTAANVWYGESSCIGACTVRETDATTNANSSTNTITTGSGVLSTDAALYFSSVFLLPSSPNTATSVASGNLRQSNHVFPQIVGTGGGQSEGTSGLVADQVMPGGAFSATFNRSGGAGFATAFDGVIVLESIATASKIVSSAGVSLPPWLQTPNPACSQGGPCAVDTVPQPPSTLLISPVGAVGGTAPRVMASGDLPPNVGISGARVQSKSCGGFSSPQTCAFTSNNTAGNSIVVDVLVQVGSATPTVTDTNNSYGSPTITHTQGGWTALTYVVPNIAAGANTVSVAQSGLSSNALDVTIAEYAGVVTSSPVDISGATVSSGLGPSIVSVTTTVPGDILHGVAMATGATTGAQLSNWVKHSDGGGDGSGFQAYDYFATGAGVYALDIAYGNAPANTFTYIVALKAKNTNLANIPSSGVSSFTGDGALLNNSASIGAVTATLANAPANSVLGNATGSSAAPVYTSNPVVQGITTVGDGVHAGISTLIGNTANPTIPANNWGWLGPNSATFTSLVFQATATPPTAGQSQCFGVPSGNVSQQTWCGPFLSAVPANTTITVGSGIAFSANTCSSYTGTGGTASTTTMTGLTTAMTITHTPTTDTKAVTGWGPGSGGQLYFASAGNTSNTLTEYVCNATGSTITTSGSVTFNVSAK